MAKWSTSSMPPELAPRKNHTIEAVVDRVVIREGLDDRGWPNRSNWRSGTARGRCWSSHFARRPARSAGRRVARSAVQHAPRLPQLQAQLRGTGAAHVQLQQSLRRLPEVRRAGLRGSQFDPDLVIPDRSLSLADGRHRALEERHAGGRAPSISEELAAFASRPPASTGQRRWPSGSRSRVEQLLAGRRQIVSRPGDAAGKGICHGDRPGQAASGWKRFAAAWLARPAAARGCGPRPAPAAWRARRFTRSRR